MNKLIEWIAKHEKALVTAERGVSAVIIIVMVFVGFLALVG